MRLEQLDLPAPQGAELLVQNELTSLCTSDLHTYFGRRREKSPTILGHETAGRILAFGPGAARQDSLGRPLAEGDRITWAIYASPPGSFFAQISIPQKGEGLFKYGHEELSACCGFHGGLAEHTLLRPHTPLLKLREDTPLATAALISCAISTAAGALRLAGNLEGKAVLLSGAGTLGLAGAALCKEAGAGPIFVADPHPERRELALRFGADETFPSDSERIRAYVRGRLGERLGIRVAFDFSGAAEAMELGLELLGIGGTALWAGATAPLRPLAVNAEQIVRKLLSIKGLHNYNEQDFQHAAAFAEACHARYPLHELVSAEFPLEAVNEAFHHAETSGALRVAVRLSP
jgi:alcohol dehydrogenase